MKDFDALKDIWHGQATLSKVNSDDILKRIRNTRQTFANKLLLQAAAALIAVALLTITLFISNFRLGTTYLALMIFIVCCLFFVFIQVRHYRNLNNSETLLHTPAQYITWLKNYRQKRYILNTRTYRLYLLFISIGLALYLIEIFFYVSMLQTVLAIVFTVAWFILCYYVFMRRYIRKEETRLNTMITNLERLQGQFNENED